MTTKEKLNALWKTSGCAEAMKNLVESRKILVDKILKPVCDGRLNNTTEEKQDE